MVETCKLLGEKQLARTYTEKRIKFTGAVRREYLTSAGRLAFDTVSAQALALAFKIVPEKHVKKVAKALNENVLKHGCAVVTGFAATPYLLFALADNGYFETAEKVLMNSGCPGWLYEVDMGATTVWERWDSMRPDYTPNPDAMTSFNHYAYGSVQDFIVRRVAGIEPVMAGYRSVLIAPHPVSGIKSLSAEYEAAKGKIYSGYEYADGIITYTFKIPDGVKGNITLPGEPPVILFGGVYEFKRRSRDLGAAPYTPESFVDGVFTNPKAVKAFNKVFGGIFTGSEIAWMKGKAMTLYDMAKFRDGEKKMKLSDFPDMLKRANELFLSE